MTRLSFYINGDSFSYDTDLAPEEQPLTTEKGWRIHVRVGK
jgi:hypothetical protein